MAKWILFIFGFGTFSLMFYLFFYLGAYKEVEIFMDDRAEMHMVYKKHYGPYHELNDTIISVEKIVRDKGVKCDISFGEFIDDPAKVDPDRLRSHGGCLVPKEAVAVFDKLFTKTIPAATYVVAQFEGSPAIGPYKVYPALNEFVVRNGLTVSDIVYELYDIHPSGSMTTTYLMKVQKKP